MIHIVDLFLVYSICSVVTPARQIHDLPETCYGHYFMDTIMKLMEHYIHKNNLSFSQVFCLSVPIEVE